MMYASRTPRDLNRDPEPFVSGLGKRHAENLSPAVWRFDPRPEFDHVQHNEPNPIFLEFREDMRLNPTIPVAHLAQFWIDPVLHLLMTTEEASPEHIDHARRVLSRLANLKEES